MFCFVHASDVHLGAAFDGVRDVSPAAADALRQATYTALNMVVQVARDTGASFVVLAGDLCNRADGNLKAELALRKAARDLGDAGVPVFIVYGNHDYLAPGRPDLDWPETTFVFPPEVTTPRSITASDGRTVCVFGLSYSRSDERENLALRYPPPPGGDFSVAVLHAACGPVGEHASYAPCTLQDLSGRGYDYWALGHVHSFRVLQQAKPVVVYSGCTQGMNPLQTGPRGCCLVTVHDDGHVETDFKETDTVRWFVEEVDIAGMDREQQLVNELEQRLRTIAGSLTLERSALVRFHVTGRGPLHRYLRDSIRATHLRDHLLEVAAELLVPVWTETVQVATRSETDLDARRQADDFLGSFLRIAEEIAGDDDKLAGLWQDLRGQIAPSHLAVLERAGAGIATAGPEDLRSWLKQAEVLGTDLLVEED